MAQHSVSFIIPWRDLGKADVQFSVKKDGAALGKLEVSKGAVVWFPGGKSIGYKLSWSDFDRLMTDNGRRGPERR